ncbi:MAG: hypothetical protein HKL95_03765, partial [Phycisphaerae bacterium]|nr:hypothetical protein [Phycisphaerae bacterium]
FIGWPMALAHAGWPTHNGPAVVVTAQRQIARDDEVRRRLMTAVTVHFSKIPIRVALRYLAHAAHVNLFVYWHALAADGCGPSTRVTVHFTHPVTVATALRFSLAALAAGGPSPLGYTASHGLLMVGPRDLLAMQVVTRCYRLGPLMLVSTRRHPALSHRLQAIGILKLLENTADRSAWVDNGGTVNIARYMDGTLIITASERDQWRIQRILTALAAQVRRRNRKITQR